MAAPLVDDLGAAVRAAVEEDMHAAVAVTGHHHRLPPKLGREIVPGIRHLAGMTDEQPRAPENPLHLQFEHVRVGIDAAVDAAGLDQIGDRCGTSVMHWFTRLSRPAWAPCDQPGL